MLTFIAKRYAKLRYRFAQLTEAASNELNAGLALRNATEKRDLAAQLTKQADEMDARTKELDGKLEKGFWECENGHETESIGHTAVDSTGQILTAGEPAR